jgi:putative two-component system response regulator
MLDRTIRRLETAARFGLAPSDIVEPPMRVLIVDDSPIALSLLEKALAKAGHQVDAVASGDEALEWVRKGVHRLIISDWDMPQLDGPTLCEKVRKISTNYVYFILLTSHRSAEHIVTGLSAGADDFIAKPFDPEELLLRVSAGERILSLESRDMVVFAMAQLAESRDRETGKHLERVRTYARLLTRRLISTSHFADRIDDRFAQLIYETSPLHDIGKVGIPDAILLKPGELSSDERAIMQTHTALGAQTLDAALEKFPDAKFLRFARDIVACHHERFDGSGYPRGLVGEDIPLCARIVAVADVYDACTSNRVYRAAMTHEEAVKIIANGSGTHFDPAIVSAFLDLSDDFARVCRELADTPEDASAGAPAVSNLAHPGQAPAALTSLSS